MVRSPSPIRHSLLTIRLSMRNLLSEKNNNDTLWYFRKEKSSDLDARRSARAATRAKATRKRNGRETAFPAGRTGNEFQSNRGTRPTVTGE